MRHMQKTALLFAGQGAQAVGMGKDLAEKFPSARKWFDRANAALGYDLAAICFNGPEAELTKTENAQPGIFLVSWVAFELLKEQRGGELKFDATAGLSLGEFTALTAAGAMSFEDGLRVVRERGKFMQEACDATRGGMAAIIGLDEAPTREVCAQAGVTLANLNCPGQIVISGEVGTHWQSRGTGQGQRRETRDTVAGGWRISFAAHVERATKVAGRTGQDKDFRARRSRHLQRDGATARRGYFVEAGRAGLFLCALGKFNALFAGARLHALHRAGAGHRVERLHETH